ncbi:MAG: hypothetical protein JNL98_19600 [Bryobacterales bacterium]|nr:hypothetical protein [Bryobacterales bacterium]
MKKKKQPQPDSGKSARRVARNVVGVVPSTKVIVPRTLRKPKHKKQEEAAQE